MYTDFSRVQRLLFEAKSSSVTSFWWDITGEEGQCTACTIRMQSLGSDPSILMESPPFSIRAASGSNGTISVTQPEDLSAWRAGTTWQVKWAVAGSVWGSTCQVELWKSRQKVTTITDRVPTSSGTVSWTSPRDLSSGSDYYIILRNSANARQYSQSALFRVLSAECSNACSGAGVCVQGVCVCQPLRTGASCEDAISVYTFLGGPPISSVVVPLPLEGQPSIVGLMFANHSGSSSRSSSRRTLLLQAESLPEECALMADIHASSTSIASFVVSPNQPSILFQGLEDELYTLSVSGMNPPDSCGTEDFHFRSAVRDGDLSPVGSTDPSPSSCGALCWSFVVLGSVTTVGLATLLTLLGVSWCRRRQRLGGSTEFHRMREEDPSAEETQAPVEMRSVESTGSSTAPSVLLSNPPDHPSSSTQV